MHSALRRSHRRTPPSPWQRELARVVTDLAGLERHLDLDDDERAAIRSLHGARALALTPHVLRHLPRADRDHPLRRQLIPRMAELAVAEGEHGDPLAELQHMPVPGLVHRYPDRALLLVTGTCAAYCRFCTRARLAGTPPPRLDAALEYLHAHDEIREVILSGGDPLMLDDRRLELLLRELRTLRHVEVIRLGTRLPVFVPRRITARLVGVLRRAQPLFVLVHINHAVELDAEVAGALGRLVNAGVPVLSQTVLLRGINDDAQVLENLFRALLQQRVVPYYLHQCDLVSGSAHVRVPLERAMALIETLRDRVSGLALPDLVVDLPEAGGKVRLHPGRVIARDEDAWTLRAVDGRSIRVPTTTGGVR
ncbi:MAG: KamA family radical SAM protein [Pseudomonadota bacterium]